MSSIWVIAKNGVKVPYEGIPKRYITDAKAVQVFDSQYYQRRRADGDLLAASEKQISDATDANDAVEKSLKALDDQRAAKEAAQAQAASKAKQ